MRVLFHADLSHGQAAAVWRCRHLLEGVGIELVWMDPDAPRKYQPAEVDLILVHSTKEEWPVYLETVRPIVILERIDGAQLSAPVRKHIGHENLKAIIKNTVYDGWQRYNTATWRGHEPAIRHRMSQLGEGEFPCDSLEMLPESKWITPEQAAKLKLGFSFLAYPHYDAFREITPGSWPAKTIDLHFAGTTDYGPELGWLNWHRQKAVEAIRRSGRESIVADNRAFQFAEYYAGMKQSRFVVSPWGLGEPCYRDFEAILCGCMVVKPDTTYIKTVPGEFYKLPHFSRCVCKPDFSDLEEVVSKAQELSVGDKVTWANWLLQQNSTEAIAKRLAKIFREAVQ